MTTAHRDGGRCYSNIYGECCHVAKIYVSVSGTVLSLPAMQETLALEGP